MSTTHRSILRAGVAALACLATACQAPAPQPDAATDEELWLLVAGHDVVQGTYRKGATLVRFEMTTSPTVQRMEITSATGDELVSQRQYNDTLEISVFGGRASTYTNLVLARASAQLAREQPALQQEPSDGGESTDATTARRKLAAGDALALVGDQNEFLRFEELPEAAVIPWLSRALGMRGYNGRDYPVTIKLHMLASGLASRLAISVPHGEATDRPSTDTARRADGEGDDDGEGSGSDDGGGGGGGGGASCQDLRGDPNGDDSFGMCGPGGSCWEWTCGDCCCHDGCKSHDWTCRNCRWYRPWNCILCGTFTSMLAGLCGTSCQETTYAEPCTIGPYEACNGSCICTGTYDGSSEDGPAPVQWGCQQQNPGCDPYYDPGCDQTSYCMPLQY